MTFPKFQAIGCFPYTKTKVWNKAYREASGSHVLSESHLRVLLKYLPETILRTIMISHGSAWKMIFPLLMINENSRTCLGAIVLFIDVQEESLMWNIWMNNDGHVYLTDKITAKLVHQCSEYVARTLPEYIPYAFTAVSPLSHIEKIKELVLTSAASDNVSLILQYLDVTTSDVLANAGSIAYFCDFETGRRISKFTYLTVDDVDMWNRIEFPRLSDLSEVTTYTAALGNSVTNYIISIDGMKDKKKDPTDPNSITWSK